MVNVLKLLLFWLALNLVSGVVAGVAFSPFKGIPGLREHALFLIKLILGAGLFYYLLQTSGKAALRDIFSGFIEKPRAILGKAAKFFLLYLSAFTVIALGVILAVYALSLVSGIAADSFSGVFRPSADFERFGELRIASFGGVALYFAGVCVLTPLIEEVFYRRLLYSEFRKYYGLLISITVSALVFGVFHPNMLVAAIDGAFLCYVYEKERDIQVNVTLHAFLNTFFILLIFSVKYFSI
jgi:membrane protease YdiL (CAAX protease family)